ncbi:MAG: FHA domain-containing protein [Kiritimatiellia bacterium]
MSADNKPLYKVVVEAGPNRENEFAIPSAGARVGRSSQNDIALADPLLSRHHCRFELRDTELWLVDLASANQSMVNGKIVEECRLHIGDAVQVGDTIMRVTSMDGTSAIPGTPDATTPAANLGAAPAASTGAAVLPDNHMIDLGLNRRNELPRTSRQPLRPLLWSVAGIAVLLLGIMLLIDNNPSAKSTPQPVQEIQDLSLQIIYEKIEADPGTIFRYEMTLSPDNLIAIRIDDLKQDNHPRKELRIPDVDRIKDLARELLASGFFKLDASYVGINPQPGSLNSWDLTIIVGRQAHHCRVINRLEPEVFRAVRERIETFGKNELGIWAIQFSRDKLIDLAADAFRVGRKNYDEREIQYGNLFQSIIRFDEAAFYLQTVNPKPDFESEVVESRRRAQEELNRRYKDQCFRADRASNLQDWQTAAQELRVLRELVPDRNDERYKDATRKLIDVEARLKPRRK